MCDFVSRGKWIFLVVGESSCIPPSLHEIRQYPKFCRLKKFLGGRVFLTYFIGVFTQNSLKTFHNFYFSSSPEKYFNILWKLYFPPTETNQEGMGTFRKKGRVSSSWLKRRNSHQSNCLLVPDSPLSGISFGKTTRTRRFRDTLITFKGSTINKLPF